MKKQFIVLLVMLVIFIVNCSSGSGKKEIEEKKADFKVVKKFYADGENEPYFFASFLDICTNDKYIYVSDWKGSFVKIFDKEMNFVKKIGKKGNGPGEFGGILGDMVCNNNYLFISIFRRLHIFTTDGGFVKSLTLRFMPRRLVPFKDKMLFKLDNSPETLILTDFNGEILSKHFSNEQLKTEDFGTITASPEFFLDSRNRIFLMSSLGYDIRVYDSSFKLEHQLKSTVDFDKLRCKKDKEGRMNLSGGHSQFFEGTKFYYYWYQNSLKEQKIDVFEKGNLKLSHRYHLAGEMIPQCKGEGEGEFFCRKKNEGDTLYICSLKVTE